MPDHQTVDIPSGLPWDDGRWACAALHAAGYEAWLVGGCVRDLLLGRAVHDVDVATSAHPEQVAACFEHVLEVGRAFGVMIAVHPSGRNIEIATYRNDGAYIDGRRPSGVTFATAVEDVHRRDFTINALLLDPLSGQVVDHVGGLADLQARILRVIDDAGRLAEDRLRVLRGLRFAAHLGLTIEPQTWAALIATPLEGLSRERIWQEVDKGLSQHPAQWWHLVVEAGFAQAVFPVLPTAPVDLSGVTLDDDRLLSLALILAPTPLADLLPWLQDQPIPRDRIQRLKRLREGADLLVSGCPVAARRRVLRSSEAPVIARYLQCQGLVPHVSQWLAEEQAIPSLPPLLRPADLLAAGIRPGPLLGRLLAGIEEGQLEGRLRTADDALAWVRRSAAEHGR
jgi:tRNA nucleotidyltransferase/poly(A) polymerase